MIYFWSDPHFYHRNIIKYCDRYWALCEKDIISYLADPYDYEISEHSVALMNFKILKIINSTVNENDTLIFLGDFSFKRSEVRNLSNSINCRDLRIVLGNHDNREYLKKSFNKIYDSVLFFYLDGKLYDQREFEVSSHKLKSILMHKSKKVYCNHYMNYTWPFKERGSIHVYGHNHGNLESFRKSTFPKNKCIDVGVDNILNPISIEDLFGLFKED